MVVTARASYSRMKSALMAIHVHPHLELQLVVVGSLLLHKYGNAVDYIEKDGLPITAKVFLMLEGDSSAMARTTGLGVLELTQVFFNLQPDAVVTIADRFETIAASIAASYQNIPLVHVQGGEVTGNIDEKVRHANTKLADLHIVCTEEARERVIRLGEDPAMVMNVGCPSIDLAREVLLNPGLDFDPVKKYKGMGAVMDWRKGYLVIIQHSVTTELQSARQQIQETLNAIDGLNYPAFWFSPNSDAGSHVISREIKNFLRKEKPENIRFFRNMEARDFLLLLKNSRALVGNSSVGLRECAYLGVPVVNIGNRQYRRSRGENVIDVGYEEWEIRRAIYKAMKLKNIQGSVLFGDGEAGKRIADILAVAPLKFNKVIAY